MLWLKIAAAVGCACAALLWAGGARAEDTVLLLDSPSQPRTGLAAALGIQLVDVAGVEVRHELPEGSVSERIAAATALGERQGSLLVVWSDEPMVLADGSGEAVLYAVAQRDGRALLQVVRVPGGSGPDVDRALALKVGEVIRELQQARAASAQSPSLQLQAPALRQAGAAPKWGLLVVSGLIAAPQSNTALGQWGAVFGAGADVRTAGHRASVTVQLEWFPTVTAEHAGGTVRLSQLTPELAARSQWRQGPVWLGAHAGLGVALLSLHARTSRGRSAWQDMNSVSWLLGLDAEVPVVTAWSLGVSAGLEGRAIARRFDVNAAEVTAAPQVRPRMSAYLAVRP